MKNKKSTVVTSVLLALALSLSACATDDDNGGTIDPGGDTGTTGPMDDMTTTTAPAG